MAKLTGNIPGGFRAKKPKPGGGHNYSSIRGDIVTVRKNPRNHAQSAAESAWTCTFACLARYTKQPSPGQFNEASTQTDNSGWYYRDALHSAASGKYITGPGGLRITTPTVSVKRSAPEALVSGVAKVLTPDIKNWDTNFFWDFVTHPTRLRVRSAGLYLIGGQVFYTATNGQYRETTIRLNGVTTVASDRVFVSVSGAAFPPLFTVVACNEDDYFEILAQTNVAGPTGQLLSFWMVAITPELVS